MLDDHTRRFAQTDMGAAGAKYFGLDQAAVSVKDSVAGIMKHVCHCYAQSRFHHQPLTPFSSLLRSMKLPASDLQEDSLIMMDWS